MIVASFDMRVIPQDPDPSTFFELATVTDEGGAFNLTVIPVEGALEQMLPSSSALVEQRPGVALSMTGLDTVPRLFDGQDLTQWSVTDTAEGTAWQLSAPSARVDAMDRRQLSRIPDPLSFGGPPPGMGEVRVGLFYLAENFATFEIPLLTGGKSRTASRAITLQGDTMELSGDGPEGFWQESNASLQIDPCHGLTAGQVCKAYALAGGVPEERIAFGSFGPQLFNEVSLSCAPWWGPMRECARAHGQEIVFDRQSPPNLVARPVFDTESPPAWTFADADLLGEGINIEMPETPPTCVVVTGSRQVCDGQEGEPGATRTEIQVTSTFTPDFAPPSAYFRQTITGGLQTEDVPGQPAPSPLVLTERVTRTTVADIATGCVILRKTTKEEWFAPEVPKFNVVPSGTVSWIPGPWVYDPEAAPQDKTKVYLWVQHRFVETSSSEEVPIYDANGYKIRTETRTSGWYARKRPVIQNDSEGSFVVFIAGSRLADGTGVVDAGELYFSGLADPPSELPAFRPEDAAPGLSQADRVVSGYWLTFTADDVTLTEGEPPPGTKDRAVRAVESFAPEGTGIREYADGAQGDEETEPGRVVDVTTTEWSAQGTGGLIETKAGTDSLGLPKKTIQVVKDGSLPSADQCSAKNSARRNTQDARATFCASELSEVPKTMRVSSPWIEDDEQAEAFARQVMKRERAPRVSFSILPVGALRALDPIEIDLRWYGDTYAGMRVAVSSVSTSGQGSTIRTAVSGLLKP